MNRVNITRRGLLIGLSAAGTFSVLGGYQAYRNRRWRRKELPVDPHFFVQIATDSSVTVISKHLEMGQGILTGLAMIVAEELDADWSQMRAAQAPADIAKYFNGQWGRQETAASSGMSNSWMQMRTVGAGARKMLIDTAAEVWKVPSQEIVIDAGRIIHAVSGNQGTFGEFADQAMGRQPPDPKKLQLKPPSDWKIIGQRLPRLDTVEKVDASAEFALDIKRTDMLRAVVLRPPRFGGRLKSYDAREALIVPGVVEVVEIPTGVAVLAENTWSAMKGREALVAEWDDEEAETRSSEQILADYRDMSQMTGVVSIDAGDAEEALALASEKIDFEFTFPYLAHAPMEPLTCVMERTADGVTVWAGCQAHTIEQRAVAKVLGIEPDHVKINTTFAGASFGRRTNPRTDWIPELAEVVKASGLKRPIQLVWSREDDIRGGAYRPIAFHRGRAGLDKDGTISGWSHSIVCQSLVLGTPWSYKRAREGLDFATVGGMDHPQYRIENRYLEAHSPVSPVPVNFWRSVGNSHNAFVLETIIDELAHLAAADPLEFRLRHMIDEAQKRTLEEAGLRSGWGDPLPEGSGRGVACFSEENYAGKTHVALVVEVTVKEGGIRIDRVVAVVDCGLAVNPALVEGQIEGSIGFGLSAALSNEITLTDGYVDQSNFHDYAPTRMSEMPPVEVHILQSGMTPRGVGEGAVSPIGPALGNAIFAASGVRKRSLPMFVDLV